MSIHSTGRPPEGLIPNQKDVVATTVERDSGGRVPCRPELWLTLAQADCVLVTGEDPAKVARLSEAVVIGKLAGSAVFVPLSDDAGPEERTAAREAAKEQLRVSRESPLATTEWRDHLLRTGQVVAQGRRTPRGRYEIIAPVEFCDLTGAGPHLVNRRGEIVFYDVRISGRGLWAVREAAVAAMAPAEIKPVVAASAPPEKEPSKPVRNREAVSAGDPNIENSLPGLPRGREPGSGTRGRNPGDGTKDDDAATARMVELMAEDKASSPTAAGKLVAAENKEPAKNAYRRLAAKFINKYNHLRQGREPWGDVCRRIAGEMQSKPTHNKTAI